MKRTIFLSCLFALLPYLSSNIHSAHANPIVPAQDGVGTLINKSEQRFDITGGTQAGTNLFHSLQKFGLDAGQIANFMTRPEIANILTRVGGGETSVINGLIQVTGGNSNLFIMNPAGIVFGTNASLNVPAAFNVTTANAIRVGSSWFGINTPLSEIQKLTGSPNGYGFSDSNIILNNNPSGIILNEGNLTSKAGQSIVLVGGIVINTGTISSPNGNIVIAASGDGKFVNIGVEGAAISYNLPVADNQDLISSNLKPFRVSDIPTLVAKGTNLVGGTVSTASDSTNLKSTILLTGEKVVLNNPILSNEGTDGTIRLQVSPSIPVTGFTFLDRVQNYEQIANSLSAGSQLILLNRTDSGIAKVNQVLANQNNVQNIQIVGEGNKGQIWFGKDFITNDTLPQYSSQISNWKTALATSAEILFYACNLAQTVDGKALLTNIKALTGSNIAASIDITGNAKYGGNWILEYSTGDISNKLAFDLTKLAAADVKLATLTVTSNADNGAGSLRNQVASATTRDTIAFAPKTNTTPIVLTSGEITIDKDLTIQGNGVNKTIVDGNNNSTVFVIDTFFNNVNVAIDGVTIQNGSGNNAIASGFGGGILNTGTGISGNISNLTISNSKIANNTANISGGGIFNDSGSTLTIAQTTIANNGLGVNDGGGLFNANNGIANINQSTFIGNTANNGGAIDNSGILTLQNSTIANNTALLSGGGFRNLSGSLAAKNVTISGNVNEAIGSPNTAGAIFNQVGATVSIGNSIVAGNLDKRNSATSEVANNGTFISTAPNLVGINGNAGGFPASLNRFVVAGSINNVLLPIGDYGGSTQTFGLPINSPALNLSIGGLNIDQRGFTRFGRRDVGAVEFRLPDIGSSDSIFALLLTNPTRVIEREQPFLCVTSAYLSGAKVPTNLPNCEQPVIFRYSKTTSDLLRN